MKNILFLLLIALSLSCDSQDESPLEKGSMRVSVDGMKNITPDVTATLEKSTANVETDLIINARFSDAKFRIEFRVSTNNINNPLETGEFNIEGNNKNPASVYLFYIRDGQGALVSYTVAQPIAGKMTITMIDKNSKVVSGTFETKVSGGTEIVTLSSGEFNSIPYTN